MKLPDAQVNADSLADLGTEAADLLCRGNIEALAGRYGYALSYGRVPATAIREDLKHCLSGLGAASLLTPPDVQPRVGFFKPNSSTLVAVVGFEVPADNGASVLVELIVTTDGTAQYITLEDITAAQPFDPRT